jgi:hypothetical protein
MNSFSHYQHPLLEWYSCHSWWTHLDTSLSLTFHSLQKGSLGVDIWVWKNVYDMLLSLCYHSMIFSDPESFGSVLIHPISSLISPCNHWPFSCTCSIFPQNVISLKSHRVYHFQFVFFHLVIYTYVSSISSSWVGSSFRFSADNIPFF